MSEANIKVTHALHGWRCVLDTGEEKRVGFAATLPAALESLAIDISSKPGLYLPPADGF